MENKKDNWEKITNLTEEYQPNSDLASEAILKINQKEPTVKFKKFVPVWMIIAFIFVLIIVSLLIGLLSKKGVKLYLKEDELRIVKIEDIDGFVKDKELDILYYNFPNCSSQSIELKDNDDIAYIEQNFFFIGAESFEQVNFKIILVDAIYSFSESFTILENKTQISNVEIEYNVNIGDGSNNLYAKFAINDKEYCLEIRDVKDIDATLTGVIGLLINK